MQKRFFSKTFGWEFMATGMDGNHHFATTVPTDENDLSIEPGSINGGLLERGTHNQQVTNIFIKVKSIDDTIAKVKKNGGKKVLYKTPIADSAYFA